MGKEKFSKPPAGIKTDYESIFAVGHQGQITEEVAQELFATQINTRLSKINESVEESFKYLVEKNLLGKFAFSFISLFETLEVYPLTQDNWHSGERIPLAHATEVIPYSIILALQANYKTAFQNLREFLELVVLQIYFYELRDKEEIGKWGRGKIWTPNFKRMLKKIANNKLFNKADTQFSIISELKKTYNELGAYIHTRGIPATTMGLTGSNINSFSGDTLIKYNKFFVKISHLVVLFLSIFFPNAIIALPSYKKLGHWHPSWVPREDHVECIRGSLSEKEITFLEKLSLSNTWFQRVKEKLNSMRDLTLDEIESTFNEMNKLASSGLEEIVPKLKKVNKKLEV